ncbi:MAG: hypothetical protein RIA64_03050 [Rhodospirillales bacterium]
MSGRSSKSKGDKYEREFAAYLNEHVYGMDLVYCTPLSGGGSNKLCGDADLTGTPRPSRRARLLARLDGPGRTKRH